MAVTLTAFEPKRLSLGTTVTLVTLPEGTGSFTVYSETNDTYVTWVSGLTDGGAIGNDYDVTPESAKDRYFRDPMLSENPMVIAIASSAASGYARIVPEPGV